MTGYETGAKFFEDSPKANLALSAISDNDPTYFVIAKQIPKWMKAMNENMEAIKRNDTWELVELPSGAKKVSVKWIYKTKFKKNGEVDKKS